MSEALLDRAAALDVLLLEATLHGLSWADRCPPMLKALNDRWQVIYLCTFAKSGSPGPRRARWSGSVRCRPARLLLRQVDLEVRDA